MKLKKSVEKGCLPRLNVAYLRGFTLVELMVTLAVAAVLIAIAAPSFNEVTTGSKLRSQAQDLAAGALLARSEAIKRNQEVTLCSSSDGTTCSGTWSNGWVVRTTGGDVLHAHAAAANGYLITSTLSAIVFQPSGWSASSATLTVCRSSPSVGSQERVVSISGTGMAKVTKTTVGSCS